MQNVCSKSIVEHQQSFGMRSQTQFNYSQEIPIKRAFLSQESQITNSGDRIKNSCHKQVYHLVNIGPDPMFKDQGVAQQQKKQNEIKCKIRKRKQSCGTLIVQAQQCPQAKIENLSIIAPLVFLINFVSSQIDSNQVIDRDYMHFHIMNLYMQAQRLTLFRRREKKSLGYLLFEASVKKINKLSKAKPQVLPQNTCYGIVAECLQYYKHTFEEEYYLRKLDTFITQHEQLLSGFMPLYHAYFRAVARFSSILPKATIPQVFSYLESIPKSIRQQNNWEDY